MREISRRNFLYGAGVGVAGLAAASRVPAFGSSSHHVPLSASTALPSPDKSGIEHIVVLCMENRSFDHFLGWVPGANGQQAGLSYLDDHGKSHATHRLTDWQGCGFNDPDHSYDGGRTQYNRGACDGFRKGDNDDFALGYYTGDQLPMTSWIVDNFTVFDRWHCGILGPTYPNRFYTHAAATDRISNTSTTSTLPTVWDSLASADVAANYYFSDLPFLALWGEKYIPICKPIGSFFTDVAAGSLAPYTYLDPFFLGEGQGGSNDDHPHADIRRGQAFVSEVVNALMSSSLWSSTVFVLTYDEWGGFFDHVAPPQFPDLFTPTATEEHNTAGFRVPTFVISPFAPKGIASELFEHSAILKLAEWRFGLPSLTPRDAASANPATMLDFSAPNLHASAPPTVLDPGPHICGAPDTGMAAEDSMWRDLAALPVVEKYRRAA